MSNTYGNRYIAPKNQGGALWGVTIIVAVFGLVLLSSDSLSILLHWPSFVLVFGGTIGVTLLTFSLNDLHQCCNEVLRLFDDERETIPGRVTRLLNIHRRVRREGKLVLEQEGRSEEDTFFRNALIFSADCTDSLNLREWARAEGDLTIRQLENMILIVITSAQYAPAIGFIGTLLGLLKMLNEIESANSVGPAMALALITTLYGSILSQLVLLPLAGRMRARLTEVRSLVEATITGLENIISDKNPVEMAHNLSGYLGQEDHVAWSG
jgi:chemotaxis protein MotA